jgi:guanylate kinase
MTGHLYILCGPSGCGKTTLLNALVELGYAEKAPKYSERPWRGETDDVIHVDDIEQTTCNVLYVINDNRYGIDSGELRDALNSGRTLGVILSDLRVVRRLKQELGGLTRAIYIASPISEQALEKINVERYGFVPTSEQRQTLEKEFARLRGAARIEAWDRVADAMSNLLFSWQDVLPEAKSLRVRATKIRQFHNRYIDNIALFDHVVLNFSTRETFIRQGTAILRSTRPIADKSSRPHPIVFMVCAPPGAGKGTLMENLNIMGRDAVRIVTKMAKRAPEETDKRDGMIALGEEGLIPSDFDWRWFFHGTTEYAVSRKEIESNIASGRPQIFISNMSQIEAARSYLGDRVVLLYLHSTLSEGERRAHFVRKLGKEKADARVKSAEQVFADYVENIAAFDHVLLNTTFPEDLYDQMFRLLEYYS